MTDSRGNICGEISKLEEKVVYAISRLQSCKTKTGKRGKLNGVSNQQVVDYLKKNYCYLDGDIESQVTTALLSCVKTGIVCLLNNGKFRLVGLNSKSVFSNCLTRASHGGNCKCHSIINLMTKIYPNTCCSLELQKKSPKCNINKILRKSQKKRRKCNKVNKCKLNCTKPKKQKKCRQYVSPCVDVSGVHF